MQRQVLRFLVELLLLFALPSQVYAADTIRLGISIPMTGEIAAYGDDLKAGIDLAIDDINAKGGILGKKLEPLIEDDAADPKTSVIVANRFLSEHVDAVINGVSRTSLAIAPLYAEENLPFLNFASTDAITAHGWQNVVRIGPKNGQEAPKLAALISKQAARKKLALIYSSEEYSANLTETTIKLLKDTYKIKPENMNKLSDKETDFSSLISSLKDQKIDVVFLGLWPKGTGLFLRQAAAADYHPVFMGDFTASLDELPKIAGPYANGLIFTMTPDPEYMTSAQSVLKALAARHTVHHPFAVYGYMLIQVYAEAVAKAGSSASDKVMAALKTEKFPTIMGTISFASNGDMQGFDFDYYQWKDGKIIAFH